MGTHQNSEYPDHGSSNPPKQSYVSYHKPNDAGVRSVQPQPSFLAPQQSVYPAQESAYPRPISSNDKPKTSRKNDFNSLLKARNISKKWQRRLYWLIPLGIVSLVFAILFAVYKSDFEKWVKPLADWLKEREAWSWVIPTAILFILSFPPLFGHEIVQLIIGLTYPIGVAIGIACAGAILGEAGCFILFKYFFTGWVDKKVATKLKWAAVTRVTQEAGFRGVLVIRYSIVPPHLANPLFSCTGMKFWLYMTTVILSLPKSVVFVVLGSPGSEHSNGAKYGKVVAIAVLVAVTIFASIWIRQKMAVATEQIQLERGIAPEDEEELNMLNRRSQTASTDDIAYDGAANTVPYHQPYDHTSGVASAVPYDEHTGVAPTMPYGRQQAAPQDYEQYTAALPEHQQV